MEFELIDFKFLNVKYILKNYKFVYFYQATRAKSAEWLNAEQAIKTLNLDYYKVYNKVARLIISKSIFKKNVDLLIWGNTYFMGLKNQKESVDSKLLTVKSLNSNNLINVLALKINNKIYSTSQLSTLNLGSYIKSIKVLCYVLKFFIKVCKTQNFVKVKT